MATKDEFDWTIFLGCTFVGLGIGVLAGSAGAGLLLGIGVGLLVVAALPHIRR